ncbi:MAG: YggS family pyridoxal phosphate-dependent enzyme [Neisseriaceae bacterium]|nr:YggS family pyridoxal phosphate-dependent enzyme [Neisseriaceae bacterium]MBP6863146.1 YggS family pyridoxal phosphate-dependent enzyme [Neisseriaceae bacterium]
MNLQQRYQQLTQRLRAVQRPCQLVAVSKTFPSTDIEALYAEGQRDFGENYVQEWHEKSQALHALDIVWHFIGPLQSNKTRQVAEGADWVHTIERLKIANRLNEQRPEHKAPLQVCIQVNVSGEASKSGVLPQEVAALAEQIQALPRLQLRGLMCIPEATEDEAALKQQFQTMQDLLKALNQQGYALDTLSMGMSADWPLAVQYGATHIRIGRELFGQRDYA